MEGHNFYLDTEVKRNDTVVRC